MQNSYFPVVDYECKKLVLAKHSDGKNNAEVEKLIIRDSKFMEFPKLRYLFDNVLYLEINNCKLTSRDVERLYFANLISLSLDHNNITCIPSLLAEKENLKHLSIVDNEISMIDDSFITLMKKSRLTFIDLRNNSSYDLFYDSSSAETIEQFSRRLNESKMTPFNISDCLQAANKNLWESGELTDFIIKAEDIEFNVHKFILAANSLVFRRMFQNNLIETIENKMTISDYSSSVVGEFLEFLYLAKVPETNDNLLEIYSISAKYEVHHISKYCERRIRQNLNELNVGDVLEFANLHNRETLKNEAFASIITMFPGMMLAEELKNKPKELHVIIGARKNLEAVLQAANDSIWSLNPESISDSKSFS